MPVIAVNRNLVYGTTVNLIVWECPDCGIVYGIPENFRDNLYRSGGHYYCPNGHKLSWHETEADRQRKRADAAERRAASADNAARYQREQARTERRRAAAFKGMVTQMRRRIAAGVCPVPGCKRSGFTNVMRHVASKHPTWHEEHAHDLVAS